MHGTMTGKIFEAYLVERRLCPGEEVALAVQYVELQPRPQP